MNKYSVKGKKDQRKKVSKSHRRNTTWKTNRGRKWIGMLSDPRGKKKTAHASKEKCKTWRNRTMRNVGQEPAECRRFGVQREWKQNICICKAVLFRPAVLQCSFIFLGGHSSVWRGQQWKIIVYVIRTDDLWYRKWVFYPLHHTAPM